MQRKCCASRMGRAVAVAMEHLEDRRLFSALLASSSVLVFNASVPGYTGGGQPSHVDTLTITNIGNAALTFAPNAFSIVKDPADPLDESAQFQIANAASLPASLAPGQSAQVQLDYLASRANVIQSAVLQIASSDPTNPTTDVSLHGLGTTGFFGYNEPSLVNILRAYDIPTIVGAGPNDINASNSQYPINPDPSSTEVPMQRLVKAGNGPVTITPLATFDVSIQPPVRFGYYTPGQPGNLNELFYVNQADAQTVNPTPQGATSFDPGISSFGLYVNLPAFTDSGHQRVHYSEDVFNTDDPTYHHKFRFFPLEDPNGNVVPNAYIIAAEDYNSPTYNSFTNFVGIIRNVKPAADAVNSPALGIVNPDAVPGSNTVVFNRIQNLNPADPAGFVDIVHDTNTLQLNNSGDQPLVISALSLSDSTNWELVNPPSLPVSIAAGGNLSLTVKFIATTDPPHTTNLTNDTVTVNGIPTSAAGGVWNGTLTITSNDPVNPARSVALAGWWQYMSENENEPGLQTMVNDLFGYGTEIFPTSPQPTLPDKGVVPIYYGEEVNSGLWDVADPTQAVSVVQLAAFHNEFDSTTNSEPAAAFGWYANGSSGSTHWLFRDVPGESQSFLPFVSGSTTPAAGTFSPTGPFGLNLDGELSQNSLNTADLALGRSGHSVRIYPARDSQGNILPNIWIVGMDYENSTFDNSDFQDNVYVITNMRPATQAPAPTDLQATASTAGVTLQWAPVSDSTLAGYNVYRATAPGGPYTKLNLTPFSQTTFTDDVPAGDPVFYQVSAADTAGESQSPRVGVMPLTPAPSADVLTSIDINTGLPGQTAVITPGSGYDVTAAGGDIAGTNADGFRYLYQSVTGDFDAVVQVSSLTNTQSGSRAGLMAREGLDPGSRMLFSGATASDGYRFNYRDTANQVGTFIKTGRVSYPNAWVRLTRQGNTFTSYYSTDGVHWTQDGTLTLALSQTLYLGLAVSSHSTTQTATAQLRNYKVILAGASQQPPPTQPPPTQPPPTQPPPTQPPPGGTPPPTDPAAQVLADKLALAAAQRTRTQKLHAEQQLMHDDQRSYAVALAALHAAERAAQWAHQPPGSIDPALDAAMTRLLASVQLDRSTLATLRATDFTGIAAARAKLAADQAALKRSRRHK